MLPANFPEDLGTELATLAIAGNSVSMYKSTEEYATTLTQMKDKLARLLTTAQRGGTLSSDRLGDLRYAMGVTLSSLGQQRNNDTDLRESISYFTQAIAAFSAENVDIASALTARGNAYANLFDVLLDQSFEDKAIIDYIGAIKLLNDKALFASRATVQQNLALTTIARGQRTGSADLLLSGLKLLENLESQLDDNAREDLAFLLHQLTASALVIAANQVSGADGRDMLSKAKEKYDQLEVACKTKLEPVRCASVYKEEADMLRNSGTKSYEQLEGSLNKFIDASKILRRADIGTLGVEQLMNEIRIGMGSVLALLGRYDRDEEKMEDGIRMIEGVVTSTLKQKTPISQAILIATLGNAYYLRGQYFDCSALIKSIERYGEAEKIFARANAPAYMEVVRAEKADAESLFKDFSRSDLECH